MGKPARSCFTLLFLFLIYSCTDPDPERQNEVQGLKPVYQTEGIDIISLNEAREFENPGKIYVYQNYLLVGEKLRGIHIIENSDPSNPVNTAFISIPGNVDMAVRNNVLYVDNYNSLVAIDISDIGNIGVLDRKEDIFENLEIYPNVDGVYFECVDESKGVVVGWVETTLNDPRCYR